MGGMRFTKGGPEPIQVQDDRGFQPLPVFRLNGYQHRSQMLEQLWMQSNQSNWDPYEGGEIEEEWRLSHW